MLRRQCVRHRRHEQLSRYLLRRTDSVALLRWGVVAVLAGAVLLAVTLLTSLGLPMC